MAMQLPARARKALEEGVSQIEKAIQDLETKNLIDSLIQSYSKLDKRALFGKTTYLVESLGKLCGAKGAELILNLLTRGSSKGAFQLIEEVKNDDVKHFLEVLVMKYGAQYQWALDPFKNDWQRYEFSTKYLGIPTVPVISIKIVDKSGKLLELESPLMTYIDLVRALVEHLKSIDKEMEDLGQPHSIKKLVPIDKLQSIKKTVEELLETDKEKQESTRPPA